MTRTIFITGGIVSGLGKGITAASLGALLKARGFSVVPLKADMYLNVDAGTMNPFQHGEVFVTEDGTETDLDLGHYERFLDTNVTKYSYSTMGAVFQSVTEHERLGTYLGKTIQLVPHVTDEIQRRFTQSERIFQPDFHIIELGGTVGDYEAETTLEAVRQMRASRPRHTLSVHVVKMDYIFPSDEAKTKPMQHSVIALRRHGINPEILVVRVKRQLSSGEREKIALFCGVAPENIIEALDASSLYAIPLSMEKEGLARAALRHFKLRAPRVKLGHFREIARRVETPRNTIRVGLIGKYTDLSDSYLSVIEAAKHGGIANRVGVDIVPLDSEHLTIADMARLDAMIVPGGFGSRGVEGKIRAIGWARTHGLPFLGICLGLQCAVIEFARSVCGLRAATSEEFHPNSKHRVIAYLPEQATVTSKGGTMRLGSYPATMRPSLIARLYRWWGSDCLDFPDFHAIGRLKPVRQVVERHRHRYEVNPDYRAKLESHGLVVAGASPDGRLVEFIELPVSVHPYFVATQAHPEFKSRPGRAHPLFAGLIRAAVEKRV